MKKTIIMAVMALLLQGCFLDSLWSDHDDSNDKPATTQQMWDKVEPVKKGGCDDR